METKTKILLAIMILTSIILGIMIAARVRVEFLERRTIEYTKYLNDTYKEDERFKGINEFIK